VCTSTVLKEAEQAYATFVKAKAVLAMQVEGAQLAGAILRNPLVISPLLGILFAMIALPLPKAASNYLNLMAAALFALGLSLIDHKLTGNAAEVIWLTAVKVIANPILSSRWSSVGSESSCPVFVAHQLSAFWLRRSGGKRNEPPCRVVLSAVLPQLGA
jgi:predicted permease